MEKLLVSDFYSLLLQVLLDGFVCFDSANHSPMVWRSSACRAMAKCKSTNPNAFFNFAFLTSPCSQVHFLHLPFSSWRCFQFKHEVSRLKICSRPVPIISEKEVLEQSTLTMISKSLGLFVPLLTLNALG